MVYSMNLNEHYTIKYLTMRKTFTLFLLMCMSFFALAQSPEQFKYQAVIRNTDGTIKANTNVSIDVAILQGSSSGTEVMSETHDVTTNSYGLVSLSIGSVNSADFPTIDWSAGPYYIEISVDGTTMGTSQLLSVPYALHSKTAESYNETDPNFQASLASTITSEDTTRWNSKNTIGIYDVQQIDTLTTFEGLAVYNTDQDLFQVFANGSWYAQQMECWPEAISDAGEDQVITDTSTTVTLNANAQAGSSGVWSKISGVGGSFTDSTDAKTKFTGQPNGKYVLKWTVTTDCSVSESTINVSFGIEEGFYIVGEGTGLIDLNEKGKLISTKNEYFQTEREQLKEIYIAVEAGSAGFNIIEVGTGGIITYGVGDDWTEITGLDLDYEDPQNGLWRGSLYVSDSSFTVAQDGLYHVVIDTELEKVAMAKADWGIIGAATPEGWGASTLLPQVGSFDLDSMYYELTDVLMKAGLWKLRYSDGWQFFIEEDLVSVNCNLGGEIDSLEPGGDHFHLEEAGYYTINFRWELGNRFTLDTIKTGVYTPPTYPDTLYITGDATTYGWVTPGTDADAILHKIPGGGDLDGVFWKIVHLDSTGSFRISAYNYGSPLIGYEEVDYFDTNGVSTTNDGSGSIRVASSGMYMIVLDLRNDSVKVSIIEPEVFGIGEAFGGWTEDDPDNLFSVNNTLKTIISPPLSADGNIRTYVSHDWIPYWWSAEFVPEGGLINYRNDGGDPPSILGTAGQVITYSFDDNTSTVL
jgi:hypothetical protein